MKKLISLFLSAALLLSLCACGGPSPEQIAAENYLKATELLDSGNYTEALDILRSLGDYEDAPSLRKSAAFALTREYVSTNGSSYVIQDDLDFGKYSHAIQEPVQNTTQSSDMINNYNRFIAVDDNNQIVMGLSQYVQNAAGVILWSFQIALSETSNMAKNTYIAATYAAIGDRSMKQVDQGTVDFDISTYTADSDLDMSYDRETTNYLGEVTTETKTISWAKQPHVLDTINNLPLDCQTMLDSIGVTLGDLGFVALDEVPAEGDTATQEDTSEPEEKSEASQAETTEPSTGGVQGDAIALTTMDGMAEIKYAGYEYMPAGVLTDDTVDLSKVIVIFMDYTNHREDEPKEMQGDFWYRVFQNGVELDSSFCSYYSDKYAPISDFYKAVMMGGTVTTGRFFLLEDSSPITIMVNEQSHNDNKQSMTVELN
ncbi:hypothetical protein [Evtepia sp.]|uniref:hypothetical protein n=1 Tax=Evtepia sp. TaxID=2773933 RepID=UPI002A827739|nr:hypothetical protein [Evtepia sp.]MDY4429764.1 hypothetical protein [Evtepia sp.]